MQLADNADPDQPVHLLRCPLTEINKYCSKCRQPEHVQIRPRGYKTFFMLKSAEHGIYPAN